jgi:hypothetical protein
VIDSKGEKDRTTMIPQKIIEPLKKHLCKVKEIHEKDLKNGYGNVHLPYAIEKNIQMQNMNGDGNMFFQQQKFQLTQNQGYKGDIIYMILLFKRLLNKRLKMLELFNRQIVIFSNILLRPIC